MNKKLYLPLVVSALLLSLPSMRLSYGSPLLFAQDSNDNHEILFSIPVGDDGIHYSGIEHPDMLTWGPAAITVAPDGSFWIADTAGNRLLHYDTKGMLLDKVNIEDFVTGAGDVEVTSKEIWVLDIASQPPKLVHLTLDGKNLGAYELPQGLHLEDGLSGIALGDDNQVLIEREGGYKITRFLTADGKVEQEALEGYVYGGKIYAARPADLQSTDTKRGFITAGDIRIEVSVSNDLGGLRILDVHTDGSFFVIVEEMSVDIALRVDQTVYHYDASGKLLGMARVPLAEQHVYVSQGLVMGPDGAIYALITKPDRVEVQRLRFSPELKPILPSTFANDDIGANTDPRNRSLAACRSRDAMMSAASSYTGNYRYLNNTNINGNCANRTKPRYLGSPGYYYSVPYDWYGFDAVSVWNNYMANNYQAGDIDTSGNEGCSRGVDCSGFVSQVWGLTSRYGTCGLESISAQLSSTAQLLRGDIMNRCNPTPRHTILFSSFANNGMNGYESTTYNQYDRVVYIYRPWSSISNYVPRRYNNVCP